MSFICTNTDANLATWSTVSLTIHCYITFITLPGDILNIARLESVENCQQGSGLTEATQLKYNVPLILPT